MASIMSATLLNFFLPVEHRGRSPAGPGSRCGRPRVRAAKVSRITSGSAFSGGAVGLRLAMRLPAIRLADDQGEFADLAAELGHDPLGHRLADGRGRWRGA